MMTAVIGTLNHTRSQTLKLVADLSEAQMVLQPAAGVNHPAWVLGHLLLVEQNFLALISGTSPSNDAAWRELYGMGSKPQPDAGLYRSKAFYLEALAELREKVLKRLVEMTPEELHREHPDPARRGRMPTVAHAVLLYGTWHEAYHAGQLSTWRRVQGLPSV